MHWKHKTYLQNKNPSILYSQHRSTSWNDYIIDTDLSTHPSQSHLHLLICCAYVALSMPLVGLQCGRIPDSKPASYLCFLSHITVVLASMAVCYLTVLDCDVLMFLGQNFQSWVSPFKHLNPYLGTEFIGLIFRDKKHPQLPLTSMGIVGSQHLQKPGHWFRCLNLDIDIQL